MAGDARLLGWRRLRRSNHQHRAGAISFPDRHLWRAIRLQYARLYEPDSEMEQIPDLEHKPSPSPSPLRSFYLSIRLDYIKYCISDLMCWKAYKGLTVLPVGPYASADRKIISKINQGDQTGLDHLLGCRTWQEAWAAVRAQIGPDFEEQRRQDGYMGQCHADAGFGGVEDAKGWWNGEVGDEATGYEGGNCSLGLDEGAKGA